MPYLVRETKGSTDLTRLRAEERQKNTRGLQHFGGALDVSYRVVSDANDLP